MRLSARTVDYATSYENATIALVTEMSRDKSHNVDRREGRDDGAGDRAIAIAKHHARRWIAIMPFVARAGPPGPGREAQRASPRSRLTVRTACPSTTKSVPRRRIAGSEPAAGRDGGEGFRGVGLLHRSPWQNVAVVGASVTTVSDSRKSDKCEGHHRFSQEPMS